MTITIGYWIIPLIVTVVAFSLAQYYDPRDQFGIDGTVYAVLALVVSLIAWLIWAVLT
jgi:hypothetical protein